MDLTFNSSNIVLKACHVPGTVLDAKITDMTDRGGPCPHGASILVGETGGKLKDLVHCGRIIPRVASKGTLRAQMGGKELRLGADVLTVRLGG